MEMVWSKVYMYRAPQGAVAMRWKVKPTKLQDFCLPIKFLIKN